MKSYKLHLLRHGLTQANLDKRYMGGGTDAPLCQQGMDDLRALAARCRYPVVNTLFSSPMKRALQTAEILFPVAADRLVVEDIRECCLGAFEGRSWEALQGDADFQKWLNPQSDFVPEGGESGRDFAERTARALLAMMEHMAQNGIFEAACITHGGVIMAMLGQLGLPRRAQPQWMSDNGCGYTVQATASMLMRDQLVEVTGIVPHGYAGEAEFMRD